MLPGLTEDEISRYETFRPRVFERFMAVVGRGSPMVHYTSAEAAISIIKERQIWLRNAAFMNDASEIGYGIDLLAQHFHVGNPQRSAFWESVDRYTGGRKQELIKLFDDWVPDLTQATYVCCVSEHDVEHEHDLGRLSMWRGYGRSNGVALVVNSAYLAMNADALGAFSYPVEYWTKETAAEHFARFESNVVQKKEFLATLTNDDVYAELYNALQSFALTIKHPGFAEEREWRVIHRPNEQKSEWIAPSVVSIGGVPQKIQLLQLRSDPEKGVIGIDVNSLVNRIIIGPSAYGAAMWHAFVDALRDAGVADAESRVVLSGLPLRPS